MQHWRCDTSVSAYYLQNLHLHPKVPSLNKINMNNFFSESSNRSDVYLLLEKFCPEAASEAYTFTFRTIANGVTQQTLDNAIKFHAGTDLKGKLKAQAIIGINYLNPLITFSTGGSHPLNPNAVTTTNTNKPYLTWLNHVLAQPDLPKQSASPKSTTNKPFPTPTPPPSASSSPKSAPEE